MSWLWKSDSSTSSFEKALSKLSTQISAANVSLEKTRSTGRRLKALWTLWLILAYILTAIILVLVVGPQDWTLYHYLGLIITPIAIYGGRKAISAVFDWRASRQQTHLKRLQQQRDEKITELKKATKYDSTQELLQKYGAAPPKQEQGKENQHKNTKQEKDKQRTPQRTGLPPPPTANIPGNTPRAAVQGQSRSPVHITQTPPPIQQPSHDMIEEPGFAPNAFSSAPPSRAVYEQTPNWYDRILDVLLGEDENLAKNRLVMLCQNCRLVNGQAPPGIKTLEELGKWRCSSCGAWNGVEAETAKVVQQAIQQSPVTDHEEWQDVSRGDETSNNNETHDPVDDVSALSTGGRGTTGTDDNQDTSGMTKRVTRSAGKADVEGI